MTPRIPIWLKNPRKRRQVRVRASSRSVRERVENWHLRVDKAIETMKAVVKAKPDDGAKLCRKCGQKTHSNDLLCVVCSELERSNKL